MCVPFGWVGSVTFLAGRGVTLQVGQSCNTFAPSLKYAFAIASQSGQTISRPHCIAWILEPPAALPGRETHTVSHLGHVMPATSDCRPCPVWSVEAHPP